MIDFTGLKKYWLIIKIIILIASIVTVIILIKSNNDLKAKSDIGDRNVEALLSKMNTYKTKDSLNVATVRELTLKNKQFLKKDSADEIIIKTLQVQGRNLETVISVNENFHAKITAKLKDSITIYKDSMKVKGKVIIVKDTLRCFSVDSTYYSISGCFSKDKFTGSIFVPEWLKIVGTVKHKRFLGFLWYINRIKDRKIDVINLNPFIKILKVDYTTIK